MYKKNLTIKKCCKCGSIIEVCRFKGGRLYCAKHYMQMYSHGKTTDGSFKAKYNCYKKIREKTIVTTIKNEDIIIDSVDSKRTKPYYWSLNSQGYPISVINGKHVRLHFFLFGRPSNGLVTDHINGNKLDNRKLNIRHCPNQLNSFRQGITKGSVTNKTGVGIYKDRYRARIMVNGREIFLGHYKNIKDAINARKQAEIRYFGEHGRS